VRTFSIIHIDPRPNFNPQSYPQGKGTICVQRYFSYLQQFHARRKNLALPFSAVPEIPPTCTRISMLCGNWPSISFNLRANNDFLRNNARNWRHLDDKETSSQE